MLSFRYLHYCICIETFKFHSQMQYLSFEEKKTATVMVLVLNENILLRTTDHIHYL